MKRAIAIGMAFLLLGSTAAMAKGNNYHSYNERDRGHYAYNRGNDAGAAIGAGILGFALGALASAAQSQDYYAPGYVTAPPPAYGYGYAPAYGYAPGYGYGAPGYGYAAPALSLGLHF